MESYLSLVKRIILPLYIISFIFFMAMSWLYFPNYDLTENDISALGHPQENPEGWIFWSIGMIIAGTMNIIIVLHIKDKMIREYQTNGKVSVILFFLAGYGIIGLGIIPQFGGIFYFFHIFHASLGFGGLYLGTWIMIRLFFKEEKTRSNAYIMLLLGVVIPICFFIFQGIRISMFTEKNPGICYLNFSFWEWMLFFGIFIAYLILINTLLKESEK
ncbi:MAG: DUF998 domain-containing protein [Promethearchaeota archaeon]